jgi:hypothetical protein
MQLLAPDILEEARQLSLGVCSAGLVTGLLLWVLGWWGHRFWTVLAATLAGGILGLSSSPEGVQPLVTGLLLGVAAGALALNLVRALAFAAGGLACWLAVHAVAPTWNEPLLCFLIGGLVGLLLFRLWTMALTSLAGTLLMGYSSLCLLDHFAVLDAPTWAGQRTALLNGVCGLAASLGLLLQFFLSRRKKHDAEREMEEYRERRASNRARAYRRAA